MLGWAGLGCGGLTCCCCAVNAMVSFDETECLQMGGPEGVRAAEKFHLVTGLVDGMWVTAEPRYEHRQAQVMSATGISMVVRLEKSHRLCHA